jgi:hypothetical protein
MSNARSPPRSQKRGGACRKAMASWWRRNKFSASSRTRDLNRSTTNIPSVFRIANIALNDAMILSYDANLGWIEFSERTGGYFRIRPFEIFDLVSAQLSEERLGTALSSRGSISERGNLIRLQELTGF